MQIETALLFESVEQIYARVFRTLKPKTQIPEITIRFRKYANANSRIRLAAGQLAVDISDTLEAAPAPIHEALAYILIAKLYRKPVDAGILARYRRYLNRTDVRRTLQHIKRSRGRKCLTQPRGRHYDLVELFDHLNFTYFHGLMARPDLGWSSRPSRTTLGHYDPSHHVIVLSSILDSARAPKLIVEFVMFHEMLHLRYPTQHRGARRCVHTAEFKAAEREFAAYEDAQRQLHEFLQGC
jgi:hypothetical protein